MFLHIRKNIYNIISNGLQKLVWFFATIIMCSFSLPPSSFHWSIICIIFFSVLCPEWHHSGPLAIWLPGGFNQWQVQTGAWRTGGDEDVFITLCLCPCSLPALTLVWQWLYSAMTLDPIRQPFFPAVSFLLALGMSCSPLASSDLG